jgi:hypothetical protein
LKIEDLKLDIQGSPSAFDVGRSTCPKCLDAFPKLISASDRYLNIYINPTHYAWQTGVRCSSASVFDQTGRFTASGWADTRHLKPQKVFAIGNIDKKWSTALCYAPIARAHLS